MLFTEKSQCLPDKNVSLEEIQGIQNLIISAETRDASSISAFCNKFGNEAKSLVITAAHDHRVGCGNMAVAERGSRGHCTASKAFDLYTVFCAIECHATGEHRVKRSIVPRGIIQNVYMDSNGMMLVHHSKLCVIC